MKKLIKKILSHLPRDLSRFIIYGKEYFKVKRELTENAEFNELDAMKNLLIHAYETTIYYKNSFDAACFDPYKFSNVEEIKEISLIDKTSVMSNLEQFKSTKFQKKDFRIVTTGGTSGVQMRFYHHKKSAARELAFIDYIWSSVGYNYKKSWKAIFRNQVLGDELYYVDRFNKNIVFNTYLMTNSNIKKMIDVMNKYKPEFIHGYPSALLILSESMLTYGFKLNYKLKSLLLSSENLYKGQRGFIEKVLKCKIFTFYGHSELCGMAINKNNDHHYHILKKYGYIELIDDNNEVIKENGKMGEIVVTGYGSVIMPFIRYKTADYSSYLDYENGVLEDIKGRWTQEMLFTSRGNKISITALNMHSDIFKNVCNYQFIQNEIGVVTLKLVKGDDFNDKDFHLIKTSLSEKLGRHLNLEIEYCFIIERTMAGKQRFLVQNVKNQK